MERVEFEILHGDPHGTGNLWRIRLLELNTDKINCTAEFRYISIGLGMPIVEILFVNDVCPGAPELRAHQARISEITM